ncbi:hypothetical protein Ahy_A03g014105 isoform A [Arachis hypogaea]|uniref:Uncharacterized protein n=1 Tax=Arachis hypogaea TaxID=3818 RepID=A0A445DWZ7_ARAHY|nr:hypothetical protein Ahy_A03g014105 isoform A [Arachis hypogaea]
MDAAHAAHNTVHDVSTTATAAPANAATTPATSSEPAPLVAVMPTVTRRGKLTFVRGNPVLPRGRSRTTRRGTTASSTTPPTPTQNARAALPPAAQPRILPAPTSATGPSCGSGSMPQCLLVRPTLQAQPSATSRPPSVTRETMAAASPATQSRFIGFMPTPSLKKKKQSGPPTAKQSANDKK